MNVNRIVQDQTGRRHRRLDDRPTEERRRDHGPIHVGRTDVRISDVGTDLRGWERRRRLYSRVGRSATAAITTARRLLLLL